MTSSKLNWELLLIYQKLNIKNIFTILLVLSVIFLSCKNEMAEINRFIKKEDAHVEVMKDVEILYSDSSVVRIQINGPVMIRHIDKEDPREEFPDGLHVLFFGANGRKQSSLRANYAIRYDDKESIHMRDSVVWISQNRETLESDELIWDQKRQKVYSNKFVTITKPEELIFGYGFEANQEFTKWRINVPSGEMVVE